MRSSILHQSEAVTVRDVRCDGGSRWPGPEEESPADQIVLVRRGLFLRTVARRAVVADPTRVLFFRRGEIYRTSHPTERGDRCTSIAVRTEAPEPFPPDTPTLPVDDLGSSESGLVAGEARVVGARSRRGGARSRAADPGSRPARSGGNAPAAAADHRRCPRAGRLSLRPGPEARADRARA